MGSEEPENTTDVQVPAWVALVTYLLAWGLGGYLLVGPAPKSQAVLIAGIFLIVFPMAGFKPLEVLREIIRGGDK